MRDIIFGCFCHGVAVCEHANAIDLAHSSYFLIFFLDQKKKKMFWLDDESKLKEKRASCNVKEEAEPCDSLSCLFDAE